MTEALKACGRCGFKRRTRSNAVLCKDCKYVVSDEEWRIWQAQAEVVELSHEKEAA